MIKTLFSFERLCLFTSCKNRNIFSDKEQYRQVLYKIIDNNTVFIDVKLPEQDYFS